MSAETQVELSEPLGQSPCYPDLAGKVAFVTGGATGIGAATCRALGANGARVVVADRDRSGVDRLVEELRSGGVEVAGSVCDITDVSDLDRARAAAEHDIGVVEIVMPFAGGFSRYTPAADLTDDEWSQVIELNLSGAFATIKAFLPGMITLGRGAIVTMGSTAGRYLDDLVTAPYAAAKAGVVMLTRHLALELGGHGIRVNAVCPGTTRTERVDRMVSSERQAEFAARSPLGRMGIPSDVANGALFLASSASSWITGACLDINGGRIMM